MGRRVLPKLDPTVDFSGHLTEINSLVETTDFSQAAIAPPAATTPVEKTLIDPIDPQSFFPFPQDLEIEVGSGKGLFMLSESGRVPDRNFLGNEISKKYCRFAAYRLAQHDRNNAHLLSGDGLKLFREMLPDDCAVAVHVYFPDPWWKARHRRRRVMQPEFIADIERVLKPGGIFHFWTDVAEYFEETLGLMKQHSRLTGPHEVPESPAEHDLDYRTHFERRMRKLDHDVFRSQFFADESLHDSATE